MSNTLILNSSNATAQSNTFQYNFIGSGFEIKRGSKIAVSSITIPYSWFNVTTNNQLIVTWTALAVTTNYTIVFPSGFYSVTDLQGFLEQEFIRLGMYLVDGQGNNVYYFKMLYNTVYYSIQVLLYPVPQSLPAGYSVAPTAFLGYPTATRCMQFTVPATNSIGSIIGYSEGTTYGNTLTGAQAVSQSLLSNIVPVGSQVNSIIIRTSICDNPVVNPTDILDSFPISSSFGNNINYSPNFLKFIKCKQGRYSNLIVSFFDQNLSPLAIRDPNLLITLMIKEE